MNSAHCSSIAVVSVISWVRRANSSHVDGEDVDADGDHGESEWLVTGLVTGDMNEV